jgi:hypothetical protein
MDHVVPKNAQIYSKCMENLCMVTYGVNFW